MLSVSRLEAAHLAPADADGTFEDEIDHAERDRLLRELVVEHHAFMWRALRRLGVHEREVDDAVQKVYMTASRKLALIVPGKERAFLFGIAVRVAANERRAQRRVREDAAGSALDAALGAGPTPEDLVERQRAREVLDELLEPLPLELRSVFVLYELEGMSSLEIAEFLTLPATTVSSRLRRSREAFEAELRRWRARSAFPRRAP
jgi:RNA polymerase sigma-70 factor (ECF subfamily)